MTETQVQQLTTIILQLAAAVLPLALSWAVAHWAVKQRVQATLARQDLVGQLARTAVRAAEQALSGRDGAARKQYALDQMMHFADIHGIKVTPLQLETFGTAIEAAVKDMHVADAIVRKTTAPTGTATPGLWQETSAPVQPAPEQTSESPPAEQPPTPPPISPAMRTAAAPQGGTSA